MAGCASHDWRNADLQIDVDGLQVSDEDRVRICVEGAGQREQAVGAGRLTFPGLPSDGVLRIWVDLMDESKRAARAGPTRLGGDTIYAELQWNACAADCPPCEDGGKGPSEGADNRLLAVRLLD